MMEELVPLYFAYGSNMDRGAMAARCPASKPIGTARLMRHRFVIMREGYASVVRDPRRTTWGVLWELALADMPALDRYESAAGGLYAKVSQMVLTDKGPKRALVYVGRSAGAGTPRPGYLEGVIAAASEADLPADYVREIGALLPRTVGIPPAHVGSTPAVQPRWSAPTRQGLHLKPWSGES
jgi:hypothetical protein